MKNLALALYEADAYEVPKTPREFRRNLERQKMVAKELACPNWHTLYRLIPRMPFSRGNTKIGNIWSFDLPPILTCPFATFCGKPSENRSVICYDYDIGRFRKTHLLRELINLEYLVKEKDEWLIGWVDYAEKYMGMRILRMHVGGDIFAKWYWDLIRKLAQAKPGLLIYLYTRSVPIIISDPDRPQNLVVNISLDSANYHKYVDSIKYFDNVTFLIIRDRIDEQVRYVQDLAKRARDLGKNVIAFIEHRSRHKIVQYLKSKYPEVFNLICPSERGIEIACDRCRLCLIRNI